MYHETASSLSLRRVEIQVNSLKDTMNIAESSSGSASSLRQQDPNNIEPVRKPAQAELLLRGLGRERVRCRTQTGSRVKTTTAFHLPEAVSTVLRVKAVQVEWERIDELLRGSLQ